MRALALLLALPAAAQAQDCPTAADLANGIRFALADGSTLVARATDDPAVVETVETGPAGGARFTLAHGFYPLGAATVPYVPESGAMYDYGQAPAAMPRPGPGQRLTAEVETFTGLVPGEARVEWVTGPMGTLAIGPCAYRAFESTRTWSGWRLGEAYLPDLGLAVPLWQEQGAPREDLRPLSVEAVR